MFNTIYDLTNVCHWNIEKYHNQPTIIPFYFAITILLGNNVSSIVSHSWNCLVSIMCVKNWQPPTGDIKNTDLSEDYAVTKRGEHFRPVIRDHCQSTTLNDVQLLADVSLAADVVSRTEHGQLELQHQLHQQPCLAFLEDGDPPQRFHVHADCDFRLHIAHVNSQTASEVWPENGHSSIYRVRPKTYYDKNLIFSQTGRNFKKKFSTLIQDIGLYALILIKCIVVEKCQWIEQCD